MVLLIIVSTIALFDILYHLIAAPSFSKRNPGVLFAKFTPGAIISEVRNKIASTVFTKNKAGASIRNRTTPINRRSSGQTEQRQQLSSLSSSWRGLTQAQRDGWNSSAASFPQQDNLGQTIFLTGAQLYIRCNANLILIREPQIVDAPSPASFAVLNFVSLAADASANTVVLAFAPTVPTGFTLVVRASPPISAGKSFVPGSAFRFIQEIAPASTSPQPLSTAYISVFGNITTKTGLKVFTEMFLVQTTTGLAGIPVRGSSLIVA